MGWNVAIAVIVIVGVVAIVLTRSGSNDSASAAAPQAANQATGQPGDHWHSYLGINVCGEWLNPAPEFEKAYDNQNSVSNVGIHSHGDGLVHTHPFFASEEGDNATLGHYLDNLGWSISDSSIDVSSGYTEPGPASDPNNRDWNNGDKCTFGEFKGKPGQVGWAIDGKVQKGNPSDYKLADGATIAIGFLPKGADLGFPPDACSAFANISDQQTAAVVSAESPCRAEATTTTTPATTTPATTTP
ncbi:MAG: hypothetical protein WEB19_05565 [Acidimicrobiia bacterium]